MLLCDFVICAAQKRQMLLIVCNGTWTIFVESHLYYLYILYNSAFVTESSRLIHSFNTYPAPEPAWKTHGPDAMHPDTSSVASTYCYFGENTRSFRLPGIYITKPVLRGQIRFNTLLYIEVVFFAVLL